MSRHHAFRLGLTALAVLTVVGVTACNDQPTRPPQPADQGLLPGLRSDILIPGCQIGRIGTLATMLLPVRDPEFDLQQSLTIVLSLTPFQLKVAQRLAISLAGLLGEDRILAKLRDPNGTAPPTKDEAVAELVGLVFDCVQLPHGDLSGAFSPGGGSKVIGAGGGTVTSRDGFSLIVVPPGAVNNNFLFTVAPRSVAAVGKSCLVGIAAQYNQCYSFNVSPQTTFAVPVTIGMCTLADVNAPYGTQSEPVHERLRLASLDHANPAKIRIYDRKPIPALNCANFQIVVPPTGIGARLLGPVWPVVTRVAERVARPFMPSVAYASDGVGADLLAFTDFTTVDPVAFESGFEDGETFPSFVPNVPRVPIMWSTSGLWNRNTLTGVNNSAYPTYVNLAAGDNSGGALPSPFTGAKAMWYGGMGDFVVGNYISALLAGQPEKSGGTSVVANSGTASSPAFTIPNVTNAVTLSFRSWFEIESVNPSTFDVMDVSIEDTQTSVRTSLGTLNPSADPANGAAPTPFTSAGFNAPPVWQQVARDLSAYAGKTVRLHFTFSTNDNLYNGFRGWIIDDVVVKVPESTTASPVRIAVPQRTLDVVPLGAPVPRVWHP